jgi:hypothetical protein
MDVVALIGATARAAWPARMRQRKDRRGYFMIQLGGSFGILAALAIVVCAVLVAVGKTFISGTKELEAAIRGSTRSGRSLSASLTSATHRTTAALVHVGANFRLAAITNAVWASSARRSGEVAWPHASVTASSSP